MFDLGQYLNRIGFAGQPGPDHNTLAQIQRRHSCSIPFENISVLQGDPVSLAIDDIFAKLVVARRGGYCFEHNGLLLEVLRQIGFEVRHIGARVRLGLPRDMAVRRTHVFVSVELDGDKWIVDAGFGGFSLTSPLRWELDIPQETPHETRRIVFEQGRYFHQALIGDAWQDLCEFLDEEMPMIDQEVSNWWTSTNPISKFKTSLTVGMAIDDGTRLAVLNDRFTRRRGSEVMEQKTIASSSELIDLLADRYKLQFAIAPSFGEWPFVN